jgi:pimeloyl-ACP methyl ester carboxylesterase
MIANLTLDDTVEAMARRTLAAAPARFSLAGLSMGGYVALEIMRQAPERVTRLALVNTSARADTAERAAQRRAGMESLKRGKFVGITHGLLGNLIHRSQMETQVGQQMRSMASRVGGEAFLRQQSAILNRPDFSDVLPGIAVPTMIVVGEDDRVTPVSHARNARGDCRIDVPSGARMRPHVGTRTPRGHHRAVAHMARSGLIFPA